MRRVGRVPADVGQRLLHDPEGRSLHLVGQRVGHRRIAAQGDPLDGARETVRQLGDARQVAHRSPVGRLVPGIAQHADRPPHRGEGFRGGAFDAGQHRVELLRPGPRHHPGHLRLHEDPRDMVRDEVVQVGGDGHPLGAPALADGEPTPVVQDAQIYGEPDDDADEDQAGHHQAQRGGVGRPEVTHRQKQERARVEGAASPRPARRAVPYRDEQQAQQDQDLARAEDVRLHGHQREQREQGRESGGHAGAHLRGEPLGPPLLRPQHRGQAHQQHDQCRPEGARRRQDARAVGTRVEDVDDTGGEQDTDGETPGTATGRGGLHADHGR